MGISTQISGMITFLFKKNTQSVADGWWLCAGRNPKSSYWNVSALLTDSLAESLAEGEFAESENDREKVTIGGQEKPYVNDTVEVVEDIVLAEDGSGGGMHFEALDTPDETEVGEEIGKLGEVESWRGKGGRIVFEDDDDTDDDSGNDIDVRSNFFEEVRC